MMLIESKHSSKRVHQSKNTKPVDTAETAGALAFLFPDNFFNISMFDSFSSSNPFIMDFTNYVPYSDVSTVDCSDFMAGFASAISTLGSDCSGFSGGDCGAGSSCSCSSGGFSSFV